MDEPSTIEPIEKNFQIVVPYRLSVRMNEAFIHIRAAQEGRK